MAVSDQTLDLEHSRRVARPGRLLVLFVITAVLGVAAVVGGLAVLHERELGRILPGVSAGGVDLGGLTADEARSLLASRTADVASGSVVVRTSVGTTTLAFVDVGRHVEVDSMVADATALGRGGSWLDESIAAIRLRLQSQAVGLRVGYDEAKAATALAAFADRMTLNPIDASVVTAPAGLSLTRSYDGRRIDQAAALAAVEAVLGDPAARGTVEITAPVERLAPRLTTDQAADAAIAAGQVVGNLTVASGTSSWVIKAATIRTWLSFGWVDGEYRPTLDRPKIETALASIAKRVARPVRDAVFLRDKRGRIVGSVADRAGQALDAAVSADAIATALEARATASSVEPVELAVAVVAPKMTSEEAAKTAPLMVQVGAWTTHYQSSAHNGFSANISVPTRTLNGTVVQPGAVFDFWAGLGEVSFRTGYKLGGAIVGGHSVEGKALAGGICAASTTLFNAALRGGFEILQRQPHWYYITRYPLGLDATVSGSQTMRFRNDTKYPILIRGFASPGYVRYEIWSVPNGRTVSLSRPAVSNVVPGANSVVRTTELKAGTSERTEWPVDGKDVVVTRTVRDAAGHVIHRDTFVSHYHRMIGINRIGIG